MDNWLLIPPVTFIILLLTISALSYIFSRCSYRKNGTSDGSKSAYSCGEDFSGHMIQPDYSQFFPFAFFFTVLHVVAMVIATVPAETMMTLGVAVVYVAGAVTGLLILMRK
jgi:hypothetical protein